MRIRSTAVGAAASVPSEHSRIAASEGSQVPGIGPILFPQRYSQTALEIDGEVQLTEWFGDETYQVFAISLEAGVPVTFRLDMVDLPSGLPQMIIVNRSGMPVSDVSTYHTAASLELLHFAPETTGTYYLVVAPNSAQGVGAVTASTSRDVPGNISSTALLPPDSTPAGTLFDFAGDQDWYAINVVPGENVRLTFSLGFPPAGVGGQALIDMVFTAPVINIHRNDGTIVATAPVLTGPMGGYTFFYEGLTPGNYFVSVSHPLTGLHPYTITRDRVLVDVAAGTSTTATISLDGRTIRGVLDGFESIDADAYRFTGAAGQTITFTVEDSRNFQTDYLLVVRNASGAIIAGSATVPASSLTFSPPANGTYFIEVQGPYGLDQVEYRLTAQTGGDDYAAGPSTTGVITDGAVLTFSSNDEVDWMAVDLVAGQTVALRYEDFASITMQLVNAAGEVLVWPSNAVDLVDGVRFQTVYFDAPSTGRFYIALQSSELATSRTVTARIFTDDHPDAPGQAGIIALNPAGGSVTGATELGNDIDLFSLQMGFDQGFLIRATAASGQPVIGLNVFNPIVQQSAGMGQFYGREPGILFSAGAGSTGTWYIEARAPGNQPYTINLERVADDYNTAAGQFGVVRIGGTVSGQSTFSNDIDRFAFAVAAGDIIRFDFDQTEPGLNNFRIIDSSGNDVTSRFLSEWRSDVRDYDGHFTHGGMTGVYQFATAGTYYVEVQGSARYAGGIIPVDYTISAQRLTFTPQPASLSWLLQPGEILLTPLFNPGATPTVAETGTIRLGWFDENVIAQDLSLTVGAGQTLFSSDRTINGSHVTIIEADEYASLTNYGRIWADSSRGGIAVGGTFGALTNHGDIVSLSSQFGNFAVSGAATSFLNTGVIASIQGTEYTDHSAHALILSMEIGPHSAGSVPPNAAVNEGVIIAQSPHGNAVSVLIRDVPEQVFVNSGEILASGWGAAAAFAFAFSGTLNNSGTIAAETTAPVLSISQLSIGVASPGNVDLTNSGLISADIAIDVDARLILTNTGTIEGLILSLEDSGAPEFGDVIVNSGLIDGTIFLANQNDSYDGRLGRLTGALYLGGGSDTAQGSAFADVIYGENGNDRLFGNAGSDTIWGGSGSDFMDGGAGTDKLFGDDGSDTLIANALDVVTGGSGADRFVMSADGGNIAVTDFEPFMDRIAFQSGSGVTSMANLSFSQTAGGVLVTAGTTTIFLEGMLRELITSRNFEFNAVVSPPQASLPKDDNPVPVFEAPGLDPDRATPFGSTEALEDRLGSVGLNLTDLLGQRSGEFDFTALGWTRGASSDPTFEAPVLIPAYEAGFDLLQWAALPPAVFLEEVWLNDIRGHVARLSEHGVFEL